MEKHLFKVKLQRASHLLKRFFFGRWLRSKRQKYDVYDYRLGDKTSVTVFELHRPFPSSVSDFILEWLELNARDGYKGNYKNDKSSNRTVAHFIENDYLPAVYLCFIDGKLSYFSAIREVNGEMMLGVRLLSVIGKQDSRLFHPAFVIPIQIARTKQLGYKRCFASFSVGVRTGFYSVMVRLRKTTSTEEVTMRASHVLKQFEDDGIREINYTQQFYIGLNPCDFKPPQGKS